MMGEKTGTFKVRRAITIAIALRTRVGGNGYCAQPVDCSQGRGLSAVDHVLRALALEAIHHGD